MSRVLLYLIFIVFPWLVFAVAIRNLVLPALRTGVLQARGRTYRRGAEPIRFWSGIAFWTLMFALLSVGIVIAAIDTWDRLVLNAG